MKALDIPIKSSQISGEYHIISIRIPTDLSDRISELAKRSHRSRNEVINILLRESLGKVRVEK